MSFNELNSVEHFIIHQLTGLDLNDKDYSLDRIDSNNGYVEGNVQWVHKDVNMMKKDYNQEYFINICKLITNGACEIK